MPADNGTWAQAGERRGGFVQPTGATQRHDARKSFHPRPHQAPTPHCSPPKASSAATRTTFSHGHLRAPPMNAQPQVRCGEPRARSQGEVRPLSSAPRPIPRRAPRHRVHPDPQLLPTGRQAGHHDRLRALRSRCSPGRRCARERALPSPSPRPLGLVGGSPCSVPRRARRVRAVTRTRSRSFWVSGRRKGWAQALRTSWRSSIRWTRMRVRVCE